MGADIHIFIEWKVGDQPWIHDENHTEDEDGRIREAADNRNYNLFAKLAGVRGDGPEPKGLPKDISPWLAEAIEDCGSDGHSHSYESLYDFMSIMRASSKELSIFHKEKPLSLSKQFKSNKAQAFFDWSAANFTTNYPNLNDTINFCLKKRKHLRDELRAEKILLSNQNLNTKVECRLIFFFDN